MKEDAPSLGVPHLHSTKFEATQKGSLIKTHLPKIEGVSLLTWTRETDLGLVRDLKPIPKSEERILV